MLSFQASINYRTKPAPLPPSEKSMDDFFASKRHRDALLVGTGNIKVERFDSSSSKISKRALAKRWKQEARASGGKLLPPKVSDTVIQLKLETSFLVFTIFALAILGVKLLPQSKNVEEHQNLQSRQSPEYQFVLLGEDFRAEGPPPLVWLFDQLTGAARRKNAETDDHTIHGIFHIWAECQESSIVFCSKTDISIDIGFPALLLGILPVRQEVIETAASKALQESLERDLPPGIENFRKLYLEWVNQSSISLE